jgi:hypothetical protein
MNMPTKKTTARRRTMSYAAAHPKIDLADARAFTRPDGPALKLPPESLARLFATREAASLVRGKRTMREWVHLHLPSVDSYRDERALLKAAISYVQLTSSSHLN